MERGPSIGLRMGLRKVRAHSQLLISGPPILLNGYGELVGTQLRRAGANHMEAGMQLRSAEPEMET